MYPINALLHTPEFAELLRRAQYGPLLKSNVAPDDFPPGYDPDEVWDAYIAVRRAQAYNIPSLMLADSRMPEWYTIPSGMCGALVRTGSLTQRGSLLDLIAEKYGGSHFITQPYIEEILVNVRNDGFPSAYESVRGVLLGEMDPVTASERLVLNFHSLMVNLSAYAGRPITPQLIRELYETLAHGVELDACQKEWLSVPLDFRYGPIELSPDSDFETLLSVESRLARGELTHASMHPIMLALLISCFCWRFRPFEHLNNLMARVLGNLFLYQQGYPVFRYLPCAWIYTQWREGKAKDVVPYGLDEAIDYYEDSIDVTAMHDAFIKILLHTVETLQANLIRRNDYDSKIQEVIDTVPNLNMRQTEILKNAVLDPTVEFYIKNHMNRFGVVYSTARKDLTDLTEMGLLSLTYKGSAYVYRAVPQLKAKLQQLAS